MPTPHKHAELIKAWADGAEIEFFCESSRVWVGTPGPAWNVDNQYRIKPQPHKWQKEIDAHKAGKAIQMRHILNYDNNGWMDFHPHRPEDWDIVQTVLRIKPETVRYRLYWCYTPDNQPKLAIAYADTAWLDGCVTWHGDWQEAEVPSV